MLNLGLDLLHGMDLVQELQLLIQINFAQMPKLPSFPEKGIFMSGYVEKEELFSRICERFNIIHHEILVEKEVDNIDPIVLNEILKRIEIFYLQAVEVYKNI